MLYNKDTILPFQYDDRLKQATNEDGDGDGNYLGNGESDTESNSTSTDPVLNTV